MKRTKGKLVVLLLILTLTLTACVNQIQIQLPEDMFPSAGDIIYFGSITSGGTKVPASWYVLDNSNEELMLLYDGVMGTQAFDDSNQSFSASDIKAWLNSSEFLSGFTPPELAALSGDAGGKAELLSVDEFNLYSSYITASSDWWLSSDGDDQTLAAYVDGSNTAIAAGRLKTDSIGVRPVIRIKSDAIRLVMNSNAGQQLLNNAQDMHVFADPSVPYMLAIDDPGLPVLNVTGYSLTGNDLTVQCTASEPLEDDEKVICILLDRDGTEHCIGCSDFNNGSITFRNIGEHEYQLMLLTGVIGTNTTTYAGTPSLAAGTVSALKVEGISEGEVFSPGENISIRAEGFTYVSDDGSSYNINWTPSGWRVNDEVNGSFTGNSAEFSLSQPGAYALTVMFSYPEGTESRVINFTVADSSDGPFTVSYHPNGALGTAPMDMNRYYRGDKVTLMTAEGLSMPGAYFAGWSLTPDGSAVQSPYTMGSGDVTLFAVWREGELPEVPKTGDPASIVGFTMLALAPAVAAFVIRKRRTK